MTSSIDWANLDATSLGDNTDPVTNIQTTDPNPSLASPPQNDSGGRDYTALVGALGNLGISIGSIVTGRPVVSTTVGSNGQRIPSLGSPPIVTGQVQANTVLLVISLGLVAGLFLLGSRGK